MTERRPMPDFTKLPPHPEPLPINTGSAYEALGLQNEPFNKREQMLMQALMRNTQYWELEEYSPSRHNEWVSDGISIHFTGEEQLREVVTDKRIDHARTLLKAVSHLTQNESTRSRWNDTLFNIPAGMIVGNPISRVRNNQGNCLEFSLATMMMQRRYYPKESNVQLVGYKLASLGKRTLSSTSLGNDHYGVIAYENDQAYVVINGGLHAPLEIVAQGSKVLADYLTSLDTDTSEDRLRDAQGHMIQLARAYTKGKVI